MERRELKTCEKDFLEKSLACFDYRSSNAQKQFIVLQLNGPQKVKTFQLQSRCKKLGLYLWKNVSFKIEIHQNWRHFGILGLSEFPKERLNLFILKSNSTPQTGEFKLRPWSKNSSHLSAGYRELRAGMSKQYPNQEHLVGVFEIQKLQNKKKNIF